MRIKAVLDTSSVTGQGVQQPIQTSQGSSSGAGILAGTGVLASEIRGASNQVAKLHPELAKLAIDFTKLKLLSDSFVAFGRTTNAMTHGITALTRQLTQIQYQLKSLGAIDVSRRSIQRSGLMGFSAARSDATVIWEDVAQRATRAAAGLETRLTGLTRQVDSSRNSVLNETSARNQNTNVIRTNTAANASAGASGIGGFLRGRGFSALTGGAMLSGVAASIAKLEALSGEVQSPWSMGNLLGYVGTIASTAGVGAAGGFAVGGGAGALPGAGVGAIVGVLKASADFFENSIKYEESQITKAVLMGEKLKAEAQAMAAERQERTEAIRSYNELVQKRAVAEATSLDNLEAMGESTFSVIEKLTDEIENLGRSFSLGRVPLAQYREKMEEMQRSLTLNSQLYTEITKKIDILNQQDLDDMRRKTRGFDVLSDIIFQDQLTRQEAAVDTRSRYGTWDDVLEGLEQFAQQNFLERRTSASLYQKMMEANFAGNYEDFEMYRNEFGESRKRLSAGLAARGQLTGALQEIFKEFMTYKGLQIGDFGGLARLGGFGSTSVIQDPLLDINRDNNRLLSDILRTIREIDTEAKYIE